MSIAYLIPLFPLLGFLINGLARKSLSKGMISIIGCGAVLIPFALSIMLFMQVTSSATHSLSIAPLYSFIPVEAFKIDFAFQVDSLTSALAPLPS